MPEISFVCILAARGKDHRYVLGSGNVQVERIFDEGRFDIQF